MHKACIKGADSLSFGQILDLFVQLVPYMQSEEDIGRIPIDTDIESNFLKSPNSCEVFLKALSFFSRLGVLKYENSPSEYIDEDFSTGCPGPLTISGECPYSRKEIQI